MKKFTIPLIAICFMLFAIGGVFAATNKADWGDDVYIDSDGVIYAGQGISIDGTTKTSWGSVVSPWEDDGTTSTLTSAPTKFILTHSTGVASFTGFTAGTADIVLENAQIIDGGTNNAFKFTENSDTLSLTASGNDWVVDSTDGGIILTLTDATDGTFDIMTNNDADDYIQISTTTNQPLINFVGSNGKITAASGTIDFDNENLTTTGTASLGATTATSLIIGDDTYDVVTDDEFRFASNDEDTIIEAYGFEAKAGIVQLTADEGDDAGDKFQIVANTSNELVVTNDTAVKDTHATIYTLAKTGIITTTNDVQIVNDSATTDAVQDVLKMTSSSTGSPAAGLGAGVVFHIDDAGGIEEQGSIDVSLSTVTDAAEDADLVISLNNAGTMREALRIDTDVDATHGGVLEYTSWTIETNGVIDILELTLDNTADTATDGFGLGISIIMEDETDAAEQQASIDFELTDAGSTTEDCDIIFSQNLAGAIEERVLFDVDSYTIQAKGTLPLIASGDSGDEDAGFVVLGHTNSYHVLSDTTDDNLNIGVGTTAGTTCAIEIDANANVIITSSMKTPYQIVASTETLTENESMKLIVLNHATEFATTLPDVASSAGVTFHIVIGAAPSGANYTVVTEGGENKISGLAVVNGASIAAANEDTITFTGGAAVVGDWVELTCDGVNWYVSGQAVAATGIVFTAT